jgi:hypothetical protein
MFVWNGWSPMLTTPLIVGACVGLWCGTVADAAIAGVASGLLGSWLCVVFYRFDAFSGYMSHLSNAGTADLPGAWADNVLKPMIELNPVNNSAIPSAGLIAICTLIAGASALAIHAAVSRMKRPLDERVWGVLVIVALGACLSITTFTTAGWMVRDASIDPAPKTYGFDPIINLKAYYLMRGGMNYYDAIIRAAQGDLRINDIKNGKWGRDWGIISPTHIRQPEIFYLWTAVGYFGASGIFWAALLLAIGICLAWYWALYPTLGQRALFIPLALFPMFTLHIEGPNLFHPDWWAAMMLLLSAAFLIRERFTEAAVFAFLSIIFREVFLFYVLVVLAVATVLWVRRKLSGRVVLGFAVALGVFALAYAAHYFAEAPYIVIKNQGSTLSTILSFQGLPLELKLFGPTSYLMFEYGSGVVPGVVLAVVGLVGLYWSTRGSRVAQFALPLYVLLFLVFLAAVGASSSYWGQDIMPLAIAGCAALLAGVPGRTAAPEPSDI